MLLSLVALYCRSSDSQHNPRPRLRIGAGHSILTSVNQELRYRTYARSTSMGVLIELYIQWEGQKWMGQAHHM